MKKVFMLFTVLTLMFIFTGCSENKYLSGKHRVEIVMKDMGTISLELDADTAPITVTNFINLAEDGFYDGLTFHRIHEGFMIQGGDPDADGSGGSGKTITGEFKLNGIDNDISHVRGVISMARNGISYNSASSQFFIMHGDYTGLDGQYAAFGYVTEGMDVVDQIAKTKTIEGTDGYVAIINQPVIETIRVLN